MTGIVSIARALNISPSTVSRALTRPSMVSRATRDRVMDEAARQGYLQKNRFLQHVSNSPNMVGVMVADLNNTFSARILDSVISVLYSHDLIPVVGSSNEKPLTESRLLKQWQDLNLKGLIAMPTSEFKNAYSYIGDVPVVLVDRDIPEMNCPKVLVENEAGARSCVEHLLSLGHERIVFVSGSFNVYTFKARSEAAKKAYAQIEQAELKAVSYEELYMGAFELLNMLMMRPPAQRPTAIIAGNNALAAGLLYAINLKHLRVPDDVAIISFGDSEWSRFYPTSVSALRMRADDLGAMAANSLLDLMSGHMKPDSMIKYLTPMLMPRASTLRMSGKSQE